MDVRELVGVREQIQADHAELRTLLGSLAAAAKGLLHDADLGHERAAVSALHLAAANLVTRFVRHLEMEEGSLLPILRRRDGWGDVRAEEVLFEHQQQRLVLAAMLEDAPHTRVNLDRLDELRGFIRLLLRDMELEELMLATLADDARVGPSML
jgi:hemerythrin-like domain-containing protein